MFICDSCKARISVGIISKHIKPCTDWKLWDDYSWFSSIPGVKDFKKIPAFIKIEIHKAKIIDHKKIQLGQLIQLIQICGFDTCLFHFAHKSVHFYILYTLRLLHCSYTKSIDWNNLKPSAELGRLVDTRSDKCSIKLECGSSKPHKRQRRYPWIIKV